MPLTPDQITELNRLIEARTAAEKEVSDLLDVRKREMDRLIRARENLDHIEASIARIVREAK